MASLLYKDWSIIKKTKALYFALLYFLFILPSFQNTDFYGKTFSANFFFIFVIYLPFSYLTAYDYKYNSNTFIPAFPVTKKDIVAGRYVFVGLTFAACLILLSAARIVVLAINGQELNIMNGIDYGQTGILISIFSLYFGIVLPLYYKFGYQKLRWLLMVAAIILRCSFKRPFRNRAGPEQAAVHVFRSNHRRSDILFFIYHIIQYF